MDTSSPNLLTFGCPACQATLRVPSYLAGVKGPCPRCRAEITAPNPSPAAHAPVAAGAGSAASSSVSFHRTDFFFLLVFGLAETMTVSSLSDVVVVVPPKSSSCPLRTSRRMLSSSCRLLSLLSRPDGVSSIGSLSSSIFLLFQKWQIYTKVTVMK